MFFTRPATRKKKTLSVRHSRYIYVTFTLRVSINTYQNALTDVILLRFFSFRNKKDTRTRWRPSTEHRPVRLRRSRRKRTVLRHRLPDTAHPAAQGAVCNTNDDETKLRDPNWEDELKSKKIVFLNSSI